MNEETIKAIEIEWAKNFTMPKPTKFQLRSDWLASHGYRHVIVNDQNILKPLPFGNTEIGFALCSVSVEPDLVAEDGEYLRHFIERTHPEWFDNWSEFFGEEYEFKYFKH